MTHPRSTTTLRNRACRPTSTRGKSTAPSIAQYELMRTRENNTERDTLDPDTTHPPDWLDKIDRQFRAGDDVVAVVGPCRYQDGPWWGRAFARVLFGLVGLVYRLFGRTFYVTATNIAFRGPTRSSLGKPI